MSQITEDMNRLETVRNHLKVAPSSTIIMNQSNGVTQDALFDASVLESLPWHQKKASYRGDISIIHPGPGLVLRPLSIHDYDLGFLPLLSQLTSVGDVTREQYEDRFRKMKQCTQTYYVIVVEDLSQRKLVGCSTLVVEQKFIHSVALRGRIEDVVVDEDCRGKQLGKLLVDTLSLLAEHLGCYKLSLDCKDENVKFYETLSFKRDPQNFMVQRFRD